MQKSVPDNFTNTSKEPNCTTCGNLAEKENGFKCTLFRGVVFYDSYDPEENFNIAKGYVCNQGIA